MEEADDFIREQCLILNCSFMENESFSLDELTTENIVEILIRCIWLIDEESCNIITSYKFPPKIPTRLRLATTISDYLKKFNIHGDIGFQNILYGSINSLRSVLLGVLEKVPCKIGATEDDPTESNLLGISKLSLNHNDKSPYHPSVSNYLYEEENLIPKLLPFSISENINMSDPRKNILELINSNYKNYNITVVEFSETPVKRILVDDDSTVLADSQKQSCTETVSTKLCELEDKKKQHETLVQNLNEIARDMKLTQKKVDSVDPLLIEALKDPLYYEPELERRIEQLNAKIIEDQNKFKQLKETLILELGELNQEINSSQCNKKFEYKQLLQKKEEIINEIEYDERLIAKINKQLKYDVLNMDNDLYKLERRCKDIDGIIKKQEDDLEKMISEIKTIKKQQVRLNDALDRCFATILNYLLENSRNHQDKQALETFIKIQLYSTEILDMLKQNADLKIEIETLNFEVESYSIMNIDQKRNKIEHDIIEIEEENIRMKEYLKNSDT